jgi:hypothetical protein
MESNYKKKTWYINFWNFIYFNEQDEYVFDFMIMILKNYMFNIHLSTL